MHKRPEQIAKDFNDILDKNLEEILSGKVETYLKIQDIAKIIHIHPIHLSNTVKEITGKAPCDVCNEKTIRIAKKLLDNSELTISKIANKLTFEPTNFTKYFKKHTGKTPSEYRKLNPDNLK